MTSDLLDALSGVDEGTIRFLLETLASFQATNGGQWDFDNEVEPFVSSLVDHPSMALQVLKGDPSAIAKARDLLAGRPEKGETPESYEVPHTPRLSRSMKYTKIEGAHNRAISLQQLRDIYEYVEAQAEEDGCLPWFDRLESSPTNGQRLHLRTINLYHLVETVVKPITISSQCSLVEMMATSPQKPQWFVSHAWAEPIHDFVAAVAEHAKVRGLDDDTLYWICAYSNNQHHLEEDIGHANPKETSFYRALQASEGMLLCLDSMGTPFHRIWCCFESSMIVCAHDEGSRNQRVLLDIATVTRDGKAVVITDGRSHVAADLQEGPKFALEFKRDRESRFPLKLLEKGYEIDICAAQAAQEEDRRSILNLIAGNVDPAHEPNLSDPNFMRVNKVLRGIFAEAAARKAAEAGRIDAVVRVLKEDTDRAILTLNLGGSEYLDMSALAHLAGHPSLRQLTIDCSYSILPNVLGIAECISGLRCLETLVLSFDWCRMLEDVSPLSENGLPSLQTLTELKLDFKGCCLAVFLPRIEEVQSLEKLFIDFSSSQSSANGKALQGVLQLKNLHELDLFFNSCRHVHHVNAFKQIGQCTKLERLTLDFSYTRLNDANELGALTSLACLKQCKLAFTKCTNIAAIPWLNDLVLHGTELEINLSECKRLNPIMQANFSSRTALIEALSGSFIDLPLSMTFEVGEEVEYYSRTKRCWLAAVVNKVDPEELDIRIRGHRQNFPKKVSASEISIKVRPKNGQYVHHSSEKSATQQNGDEANLNCLLGQFQVGESVEYFARDWKKRWIVGTVTKVESEAIKIKVPGYNELRRVTAAEVGLKVRRQGKTG